MHSIGLEHEGYAAGQGRWYTESLYRSSAELVELPGAKYDIQLDRAHVVGHDEFQGIARQREDWDPGPYWDWERYMKLLGAPIRPDGKGRSRDRHREAGLRRQPEQPDDRLRPDRAGARRARASGAPTSSTSTPPRATPPRWSAATTTTPRSPTAPTPSPVTSSSSRPCRATGSSVWWDGADAWLHNPDGDARSWPSPRARSSCRTARTAGHGLRARLPGGRGVRRHGGARTRTSRTARHDHAQAGPEATCSADKTVPTDYYYAKSFNSTCCPVTAR